VVLARRLLLLLLLLMLLMLQRWLVLVQAVVLQVRVMLLQWLLAAGVRACVAVLLRMTCES